jgi:hypothetical protein
MVKKSPFTDKVITHCQQTQTLAIRGASLCGMMPHDQL